MFDRRALPITGDSGRLVAAVYLGLMRRAYRETKEILRAKHSAPVLGAADTAARDSGFVQAGTFNANQN